MATNRCVVKKRDFVRVLRREGFEMEGQNGSFQKWRNYQTKRTVNVPDRSEIQGDLVKKLYERAGLPWQNSMILNLPKEPALPTQPETPPLIKADNLSSAKDASADSRPPAPPVKPQEPEPEMNLRQKWRTAEEVEIIALDSLENPEMSLADMAKRWDLAGASYVRIRNGIHQKLTPRRAAMLEVVFQNKPVSRYPELIREYERDPSDLPISVKNLIKKSGKAKEASSHSKSAMSEEHMQQLYAQVQKEHAPLSPPPAPPPPPPAETALVPVAKATPSDAPQALKELLMEVRGKMDALGIAKIILPLSGEVEVTVMRRETFRL